MRKLGLAYRFRSVSMTFHTNHIYFFIKQYIAINYNECLWEIYKIQNENYVMFVGKELTRVIPPYFAVNYI